MKDRLYLNILVLVGFSFGWLISSTVLSPSATLVKNTATLSTVNGGNAEYVVSHAVHRSIDFDFPWFLFFLLAITMIFWFGPLYRAMKERPHSDKQ